MHKQENRIDQMFHAGLKDYSPAMPSSGVWKVIRVKLFMQQYKKWGYLSGLLLLLISLTVVIDFAILQKKDTRNVILKTGQNTERLFDEQNGTSNEIKSKEITKNDNNQANENKNNTQIAYSKTNLNHINIPKTIHKKQNTGTLIINNGQTSISPTVQSSGITENITPPNKHSSLSVSLMDSLKNINSISEKQQNQSTGAMTENPEILKLNANRNSLIENNKLAIDTLNSSLTSQKQRDDLKQDTLNSIIPSIEGTSNTEQQMDLKKFPFILEVYAGPAYSWNSISSKNQAVDAYKSIRSVQEKGSTTYMLGLEASYTFHNFFLQSGVNLVKYGENAKYNWSLISGIDTSNSHSHVNIIAYIDPNNPDNTIIIFDSVWIHREDTSFNNLQNKTNNQYSYLEIPVLFGYNLSFRKFATRISAGISLGLLASAKGNIPQEDMTGFTTLNNKNAPLKSTVLNYIFRLGFTYKLGRYTSIFAEPEFRFNSSSVYDGILPVRMKYYNTSLHLGINYHF